MSVLRRREVVAALLEKRGDLLVVAGLGSTSWDCTAAGDHPLTFPLWGGMGLAAMTGLGLALAQPARRVLVVTGDGEMLMGLGSLATIGVERPANLSVVVIDNERYGETGMQKTHTAHGVDLAAMARAAGFASSTLLRDAAGLAPLRQAVHNAPGPHFAQIKVAPEKESVVLPPREGTLLKNRFREALLGTGAHLQ
ncbi:MAG TPA: thiamine pyrophosphate-dependent enzyme [Burkholderiales bacterium]|nr:thiamine pyrophosphate-dependent enzyme [Burkholderiales bacterium]